MPLHFVPNIWTCELNKGFQRARLGRPTRRSKAHGPARGGPLRVNGPSRAGLFVYLRPAAQPMGPQAGWAGRAARRAARRADWRAGWWAARRAGWWAARRAGWAGLGKN